MDELINKMLSLKVWCVAGSTHDHNKFAYKVYKLLKSRGYKVYSLNLAGHDVDGDKSYKNLLDLPEKPDVISMVINPIKGLDIVRDAAELGIKYMWFQPGADTEELVGMAGTSGIDVISNRCVLVELG